MVLFLSTLQDKGETCRKTFWSVISTTGSKYKLSLGNFENIYVYDIFKLIGEIPQYCFSYQDAGLKKKHKSKTNMCGCEF